MLLENRKLTVEVGDAIGKYTFKGVDAISKETTKLVFNIKGKCDDTARATLGGDWRLPTPAEVSELIANTTQEWIGYLEDPLEPDVKTGVIFKSKTNSNQIFLPATCKYEGANNDLEPTCYYWTNSIAADTDKEGAHILTAFANLDGTIRISLNKYWRDRGLAIRPVSPTKGIDLGLPSGIKWASTNLTTTGFAENEEDYGDYFAWGEQNTKNSFYANNYKYCIADEDDIIQELTKYNDLDGKTVLTVE